MRKLLSTISAILVATAAAGWGSVVPASADITTNCAGFQGALNTQPPNSVITLHDSALCTTGMPFTIPGGKNLTIQGQTQADGFDGGGTVQILDGTGNGLLTIQNLTFKNGHSSGNGAAIKMNGAAATIANSIFLSNTSTNGFGGAVYFSNNASDVTFSGNTVGGAGLGNNAFLGGGVFLEGGHVTVTGNQFLHNSATGSTAGGGLFVFAVSPDANSVVLTGDSFIDNDVLGGSGGGAEINTHGGVSVNGNTFRGNVIDFSNSTSPNQKGGGLDVVINPVPGGSTTVTQANNVFDSNVIHGGQVNPQVQPRSSTPNDFGGAGEFAVAPSVNSTDDTYVYNHVDSGGVPQAGPTLTPIGGGIAVQGTSQNGGTNTQKTTLTAANMVVVNNSLGNLGEGGGVYAGFSSGCNVPPCTAEIDLFDSTVANNTVGAGGTGAQMAGDTTDTSKVVNSIVIGPIGGQTDIEGFGTNTANHSDTCVNGLAAASGAGNICLDPKLLNVPGNDVHETGASPTIDGGDNAQVPGGLAQDYYGVTRIQGAAVDMGAAEVPVPPPPTLPLAGHSSALEEHSEALWVTALTIAALVVIAAAVVWQFQGPRLRSLRPPKPRR